MIAGAVLAGKYNRNLIALPRNFFSLNSIPDKEIIDETIINGNMDGIRTLIQQSSPLFTPLETIFGCMNNTMDINITDKNKDIYFKLVCKLIYAHSSDFYLFVCIYIFINKLQSIGGKILNFKAKSNFSSEIKKMNSYMKDNILNSVHIEMKSNRELIIEGGRKIEEYDENLIKIKVKKMAISVFGKNLEIRCLNYDSLVISGIICSVEFLT